MRLLAKNKNHASPHTTVSGFKSFVTGRSKNNANVTGLLVLIFFIVPSTLLGIIWIKMTLAGQEWIDFTNSINIGPYFMYWGYFSLVCNSILIFLFVRMMKNKDKRIADDDSLTRL
jgi:TRAP-type C4-dicarboxylate transport system permease small subunit